MFRAILVAAIGVFAVGLCWADDAKEISVRYHFALTKGNGTPVCEAYLLRLNQAVFVDPPFCGRPENSSVAGFTSLHRQELEPQEILRLANRISGFMNSKKQDQPEMVNSIGTDGRPTRVPAWNLSDITGAADLHVWRYSPQVDIDNDGVPDNLILWHGLGASSRNNICGATFANNPTGGYVEQGAFILKSDNVSIDETKTKAIFGHPRGGYVGKINGRDAYFQGFVPVGASIGIFSFQRTYYFDAFFDPDFGDFAGGRQNDPGLYDVLGVFKSEHGHTTQICEYKFASHFASEDSR